jgi:hypothetical protein
VASTINIENWQTDKTLTKTSKRTTTGGQTEREHRNTQCSESRLKILNVCDPNGS